MGTLSSSGGKGPLGGVSHKDKALPIVAGWGKPPETWQSSSGGDYFSPRQCWSCSEGSRSSPSLCCSPEQDLALEHSRALATSQAGSEEDTGAWPAQTQPPVHMRGQQGCPQARPSRGVRELEPPLSLTGVRRKRGIGSHRIWGWKVHGRSDPAPRVRPCSSHPGEFVAHPIRASHHLGFGKTPFLPLQAGAVSDPCCPGQAACEAPAGSVSWLCNHRQRFLIPPPAALRGFAEQIQSEVKFPLKSSGWEGKLRYWQQQQWC